MSHDRPTISTFSGVEFWPLQPRPADVRLIDIAHALAHKCRFTGHTVGFYSVAQHSVLVSRACPPEHALWGLLHDAAEAYLPDVAGPVKSRFYARLPGAAPGFGAVVPFAEAEDRVLRCIQTALGLPILNERQCATSGLWRLALPECVKLADRRLLATEQRDVMDARPWWKPSGYEPLPERIACQAPEQAKSAFLERMAELV